MWTFGLLYVDLEKRSFPWVDFSRLVFPDCQQVSKYHKLRFNSVAIFLRLATFLGQNDQTNCVHDVVYRCTPFLCTLRDTMGDQP